MTRVKRFEEMLRQMAKHFIVSDVVSVLFVWENFQAIGFMLYMANGEYWYVTDVKVANHFELFKYPPPIPALSDLQPMWTTETFVMHTKPVDLNFFLARSGKADSLFMTLKED
jgi:hypothetical protein